MSHPPSNSNTPLRILFLVTSLPVGGAETLLVNLVRGLNPQRFAPQIGCLKHRGPLGDQLAAELPVHQHLIRGKFDVLVLLRLWKLMRNSQIDVVITVGAGDKMFWGRLAARLAEVPVVISALHSTGWPDSVGRLNRWLTPLTDAFIGVADAHAAYLMAHEHFPPEKVHTIYNGVDTDRFVPGDRLARRTALGLPAKAPLLGILAALRTEKNHELFLTGAAQIRRSLPDAQFVIIGEGPRRERLEALAGQLDIADCTHFLGARLDIPAILPALDLMALTSHNEASPVSILEAHSCGLPVVAPAVGSVPETVIPQQTGLLFAPGDVDGFVRAALTVLQTPEWAAELGSRGRQRVLQQGSLTAMVQDYEMLISQLAADKVERPLPTKSAPTHETHGSDVRCEM